MGYIARIGIGPRELKKSPNLVTLLVIFGQPTRITFDKLSLFFFFLLSHPLLHLSVSLFLLLSHTLFLFMTFSLSLSLCFSFILYLPLFNFHSLISSLRLLISLSIVPFSHSFCLVFSLSYFLLSSSHHAFDVLSIPHTLTVAILNTQTHSIPLLHTRFLPLSLSSIPCRFIRSTFLCLSLSLSLFNSL